MTSAVSAFHMEALIIVERYIVLVSVGLEGLGRVRLLPKKKLSNYNRVV